MDFLTKILAEKEQEVAKLPKAEPKELRAVKSFYERVASEPEKVHLIGEVKRASPSKGAINLDVDVVQQAKKYEAAGVSAISVLTDEVFFKGNISDLAQVAQSVSLPVLCKDFIIDEKQLIRARNAGATIILLIVAALGREKLKELFKKAQFLGLEVLVEVHSLDELRAAEALPAKIIGVNNRDLTTFKVDIETSIALGKQQQAKAVYISESGFTEAQQVEQIKENYQGILVGETLMKVENPAEKVIELRVKR